MNTPIFLITDYINNYPNLDELRKELYKKNILSKDYVDDDLLLVYHKFDQVTTTELERECRSIILDKKTKKIISYSCENPVSNNEALDHLLVNTTTEKIISKCYEGTLLSLFFKDKWYVSTRRCLNSQDSLWGNKSHYNMFMDVLNNSGFNTFDNFVENLNKDYCYYFVLIHHQNKNIVDYVNEFGVDYTKLALAFVKEKEGQKEVNLYDKNNLELSKILCKNIFISEKLDNLESFDVINQNDQFKLPPILEGVIIKTVHPINNKTQLFKLQTKSYQFAKSVGSDKNIYIGLLHLYQKDKLVDYLNNNKNNHLRKLINPINLQESYDTIGTIDALFKVCTSELFELFKLLYDIKTGKRTNDSLYKLLPKEYKDILFAVRGLYFEKKAEGIINGKPNFLQIKDIYQLLKSISTENFCALNKMRKLMYNWSRVNKQLEDFNKIAIKCDKIHFKLAAIYCNKIFPNIMPDDFPPVNLDSV